MNKLWIVVISLLLAGFVWLVMESNTEPLTEVYVQPENPTTQVTITSTTGKLAKVKGKIDDPPYTVFIEPDKSTSGLSANVPPLVARQQFLEQQRVKVEPLTEQQRNELQQKASQKKSEIDLLIVELNKQLSDKELRQNIQSKLTNLLQDYNKLILPLAQEAMEQRSAS